MQTNYDKNWGSHLPVLMRLVFMTEGNVLEMGMGLYSTPFLHWTCFPDRKLVSYENDSKCFELNKQYQGGFHEVNFVDNWDKADIEKSWDVVLIDHCPSQRRIVDIERLALYAQYIVVHDTQRNYKFCDLRGVNSLFKYRFDYTKVIPFTTVFSNFVDFKIYE